LLERQKKGFLPLHKFLEGEVGFDIEMADSSSQNLISLPPIHKTQPLSFKLISNLDSWTLSAVHSLCLETKSLFIPLGYYLIDGELIDVAH